MIYIITNGYFMYSLHVIITENLTVNNIHDVAGSRI